MLPCLAPPYLEGQQQSSERAKKRYPETCAMVSLSGGGCKGDSPILAQGLPGPALSAVRPWISLQAASRPALPE